MNYYISSDPGNAGETWSNMVLVLEMFPDGTVNVPGRFTIQGNPVRFVTTNILVPDGIGGFATQEITIVVQGESEPPEEP